MTSFLPVDFFSILNSFACCNFCCASLMASFSDCEFDRDLIVSVFVGKLNKSIGGGGGGGGMFNGRFSVDSSVFLALSLNVAFSCLSSSSQLSARILEISSSVSSSLTWIFKDSTSEFTRSSISLSKLAFFVDWCVNKFCSFTVKVLIKLSWEN